MATYKSSQVGVQNPTIDSCQGGEVKAAYGEYTVATALAATDVIELVKIPARHVVVDCILDVEDLDTNGTPTITLDVGDVNNDADSLIAASTVGQAGGIARASAIGSSASAPSDSEETYGVTVNAGPATGATGVKVKLTVFYRGEHRGK